jgi:hypothetical protein
LAQIEYLPYQKIVLHEIRKMEPAEFFPMIASQAEAQKAGNIAGVSWIDGIAFTFGEFIPTPEFINEQLKGVMHKAVVYYTETSFEAEKRTTAGRNPTIVRLFKAEQNPDFINLVKFLKRRDAEESKAKGAKGAKAIEEVAQEKAGELLRKMRPTK